MLTKLENSAVATAPEKVSFHSNIKENQCRRCSHSHRVTLILYVSKVMLKILQAELQQYMSPELPDVQTGFRKGRGTRDQIANIHWAIIKALQKIIYFYFVDYAKGFKCVDHNKLWKILKEMGIPDHLTSWKPCVQIKKQQLEQGIEQSTDSKLRKEYIRAVHCHSTYLTYMQSTWWEILGWMTH